LSDPHRVGEFRIGYTRIGVLEQVFERMIASGMTVEVTRRRRIVSSTSDLYTAHPNVTWEESTIDAQLSFNLSGSENFSIGAVGGVEGIIRTADPLFHLDRFDYQSKRYEVVNSPVEVRGRDGGFLLRKAGFKSVELEEP